eukprot:96626_1
MEIVVKAPAYGPASNIGAGSNTFVCEHQCTAIVNHYLYIIGAVSFASKTNGVISMYRLDLSADPPVFSSKSDLYIENLDISKPFCVTAAKDNIYINTPSKTIKYDPMKSKFQIYGIKDHKRYNSGCAPNPREEGIYLIGRMNDDSYEHVVASMYSYSIGTNTNIKYYDVNTTVRDHIKCIKLDPYSFNIECSGGLDV